VPWPLDYRSTKLVGGGSMREPIFPNKFQERAEQCEKRARQSSDPLVAELLIELARDFRSRANVGCVATAQASAVNAPARHVGVGLPR
jgi:hypothetical protein